MVDVCVVDYGVGNPRSVQNMIRYLGRSASVSNDPAEIAAASKIILPGVGAFDAARMRLSDSGLDSVLLDCVQKGTNILGICVGFQLLFNGSEEGSLPGLSLVDGWVRKFDEKDEFPVPHMGWNFVVPKQGSSLFPSEGEQQRFYFAHSYYVDEVDREFVEAHCSYDRSFVAAVAKKNVFGAQFHPEKSHKFGMAFLDNFISL